VPKEGGAGFAAHHVDNGGRTEDKRTEEEGRKGKAPPYDGSIGRGKEETPLTFR